MYHPGIDALSSLASTWPLKLVSVTLFSTDLYFLAGLKREAGAYFTFLLFIYTTVLIMGSMFRLIAAINKHEATAMSIAGVLILPMVIYTGCEFHPFILLYAFLTDWIEDVIPPTSMHPWFKWISYINPLSYSFESLMVSSLNTGGSIWHY
jgi:ATP-binding cassette, subfamily G (WHITE), member 2, PDR